MPRAHDAFSLDEPVGDSPTIMRTSIVDDDQPAAPEARDRDPTRTMTRTYDRPDGHEAELLDLGDLGVVAELVEELRGHRAHLETLGAGSDTTGR